ncbi:heme peroxidase [Thozetella sp. PMI_491]|nr:heme peroxidase [Thozetella sp. PMI_491]
MAPLRTGIFALRLAAVSLWPLVSWGYVWPNEKNDQIESILYEQSNGVVSGVRGCTGGAVAGAPGRSTAAEWLRNAYHDMATADIGVGTGGMDASIVFESARDENKGKAFSETRAQFTGLQTTRSSLSDLFALAAIVSIASCSNGTVLIPMRPGRVDATSPGPSGVPRPEEDLPSHTASFQRQGFNVTEMIALVACGHTIGGVHGVDFPDIVPITNDDPSDDNTVTFDTTTDIFDNNVAKQFVANVSQNPLAFGSNITTRSDFRIFNADGGNTIGNMAKSNDFFISTCATVLEKMLNTAPKEVVLGRPIEPLLVKPGSFNVEIGTDGNMTVLGRIRVADTLLTSASSQVIVHLTPRSGIACSGTQQCSRGLATRDVSKDSHCVYPNCGPSWGFYNFNITGIPILQGISSFTVEIFDNTTGISVIYDNEGHEFPLSDAIQTQKSRSSQWLASGTLLNLTVAVLNDEQFTNVSFIVPEVMDPFAAMRTFAPVIVPMVPSLRLERSNYTLYNGVYTTLKSGVNHPYDIVATGPGVTVSNKFLQWDFALKKPTS